MVTALYRRYRPETFAELIGQAQVTDPLRTALRNDKVGHAYLFSGPRGCGKTTSARILARCLNCVEGPTDTPCGVCPSCVELSREGGGSLDVVEIDAASHGGVDDARDLRERAVFAPARDRYKIFIVDEAHMVTSGGFNALLKIVEEPPEHVKFVFATTEPEKVIATIRSRTHHYPFRLVPPAQMLDYVQQLCQTEGVAVQPGVLSLVVRAGGGSVRDTLSLLDQLIAGSESEGGTVTVGYERAVGLLGYTHGALLDEVVDAVGARDASAAFAAVDRVIQTGQDPRRFVEDLLERLRDLIVVGAVRESAASVLRGVPEDELEHMAVQASAFGSAELSRAADIANTALTEMTGATSPRLHLELMIARLLVPAADESERGALARVERLERRVGIEDASAAPAGPVQSAPAPREPEGSTPAPVERVTPEPTTAPESTAPEPAVTTPTPEPTPEPATPVTTAQLRDAWPEVLEALQRAAGRRTWAVVATTTVHSLDDDVLTLGFTNEADVASFRPVPGTPAGESVSEQLRSAIAEVLGVRVKFLPRVAERATAAEPGAPAGSAAPAEDPADGPTEDAGAGGNGWNVVAIPDAVEPNAAEPDASEPDPASEPASADEAAPASAHPAGDARYGEAVVRELLRANFIEETSTAPIDRPVLRAVTEPATEPVVPVAEPEE
ncbi:MAG: DNA polymerase III subunit gamma and tau [Microbacteriaceae bacterium]|nr:DNA polymerase III subunit gamma and tau [Microbacteriaceae bacterium]